MVANLKSLGCAVPSSSWFKTIFSSARFYHYCKKLLAGHHQNGSNRLGALDEAIVPADLNLIFAQDLRMILNKQLPRSVKFTMIAGKLIVTCGARQASSLHCSAALHSPGPFHLKVELHWALAAWISVLWLTAYNFILCKIRNRLPYLHCPVLLQIHVIQPISCCKNTRIQYIWR